MTDESVEKNGCRATVNDLVAKGLLPASADEQVVRRETERVLKELSWRVTHDESASPTLETTSNPETREHVISLTKDFNPLGLDDQLDYLHELGHAWLGEHVNLLFATAYFHRDTPRALRFDQISESLRLASDWFVENWEFRRIPKQMADSVRRDSDQLLRLARAGKLPPAGAHSLALQHALLHLNVRPTLAVGSDGSMQRWVNAFLAILPNPPSASNLVLLTNRLLALWNSEYRVALSREDGLPCDFLSVIDADNVGAS